MSTFLQTLMDAIAVGSLYALIALGYKQVDAHKAVKQAQEKG